MSSEPLAAVRRRASARSASARGVDLPTACPSPLRRWGPVSSRPSPRPTSRSRRSGSPCPDRPRNARQAAPGFAVPLVVGRWSDREHAPPRAPTLHRRRQPAGGVRPDGRRASAARPSGSHRGAVAYVGVNVVTTAHRALVHDCFSGDHYPRGNGAQEVAMLAGGLVGLVFGGLLTGSRCGRPSARGRRDAAPRWLTVRLPIADPESPSAKRRHLRFNRRRVTQRWRSVIIVAEILWVIERAVAGVLLSSTRGRCWGSAGIASLWLAAFAVEAEQGGVPLRSQASPWPFLLLGVAFHGFGFLGAAATTSLVGVIGGLRGGRGGIRPDLDARVLALRLADPARRVGRPPLSTSFGPSQRRSRCPWRVWPSRSAVAIGPSSCSAASPPSPRWSRWRSR